MTLAPFPFPVPTLRVACAADRVELAAMLGELSPQSTFERFFAGGFRASERALDLLLCVQRTGCAFVAVEGTRLVGHSMWAAPRRDPRRAEIGFVVAEDRRGMGLGAGLARLAVDDARRHGAFLVEATVLTTNVAARTVVGRVLPGAVVHRSAGELSYVVAVDHGA